MTQDELIKSVAIAMCNATNLPVNANDTFTSADGQAIKRWELMRGQAKAAIDLVLEEAAKVVRRMPSPSSEWMADELLRAFGTPANPVPAAIRALKEGE